MSTDVYRGAPARDTGLEYKVLTFNENIVWSEAGWSVTVTRALNEHARDGWRPVTWSVGRSDYVLLERTRR